MNGILSAGALLITIQALLCPNVTAQPIHFGLEIGGTYSRFLYEDLSSKTQFWDAWERKGKESGYIMVFTTVPVESIYAFQLGLKYHTIGNTFVFLQDTLPIGGYPFTNSLTLKYISLPLRIRSPLVNNSVFYFLGADFSYLIAVNEDLWPGRDFRFSIREYLSDYNISLTGGVGYQFKVNSKHVYIQGIYGHGLGNPGKKLNETWSNQEFGIGAGYLFR